MGTNPGIPLIQSILLRNVLCIFRVPKWLSFFTFSDIIEKFSRGIFTPFLLCIPFCYSCIDIIIFLNHLTQFLACE